MYGGWGDDDCANLKGIVEDGRDNDCGKQNKMGSAHGDNDCGMTNSAGGVNTDNACNKVAGFSEWGDRDCTLTASDDDPECVFFDSDTDPADPADDPQCLQVDAP